MTPNFDADAASDQLALTALYAEVITEMNEAGFELPLPTDDGEMPVVLGTPARELAVV